MKNSIDKVEQAKEFFVLKYLKDNFDPRVGISVRPDIWPSYTRWCEDHDQPVLCNDFDELAGLIWIFFDILCEEYKWRESRGFYNEQRS